MTYREAIEWGATVLSESAIDNPNLDAWYLLQMVCKIERSFYYLHEEEELPPEEKREYELAVEKRAEHVPLQYIIGEQEFMGLNFKVNSNVLIPRQDTETLVEETIRVLKEGKKVLDLCTGSGCIIISLIKNVPGILSTACDISKPALLVAKENGKNHEVDVDWIRSDLFDNLTDKYDVIVSNPPYIPTAEIEKLMPEVRDFEPATALDGHEDGLHFYREIIGTCEAYLNSEGYLLLEIGCDQGTEVSALMRENGFTEIEIVKDLAHLDRVVKGKGKKYV